MIISTIPASNCTPQTIVIGRRGTYDTMQIAFDLSYLVESYGNGVAVLAVKRSQDESAYPAVTSQADNTLTWTITETDTYYVGSGECQLMWYVDGGLAKTIIYPMVVMRDILSTAEEPPDGYENWIEHLTELGVETQQNAQNAAQSASEAEQAKDEAVDAKEASEEAARKAAEASVHAPIIQNGYWYIWNDGQYVDTGVRAEGQKGDKGDTGEKGDAGNGIESITKTETSGLVDTYTVTYTDGTSTTFTVTNGAKGDKGDTGATGNGIQSITKTGTSGNVDTYTITYTNGQTTTFTVTNGAVTSVAGKTGAVVLDSGDIEYDPTETYQSGTAGAALNDLSRHLNYKQDAPSTAGTAGQVLSLDSQLNPVWSTPSGGGGDVSNCAPIIINTASGNVASFTDGADNRQIRKIVGTIVPVQSGSGDPSPDNVRPISGWTGANIYGRNANIATFSELFPRYGTSNSGINLTVSNGKITFSGTATGSGTKFFGAFPEYAQRVFHVKAGVKYTVSCKKSSAKPGLQGNIISDNGQTQSGWITTISVDAETGRYYGFFTPTANGRVAFLPIFNATSGETVSETIEDIQLVVGNSKVYQGESEGIALPINWQSSAGTIYGGTVTLNEDGSADVVAETGPVSATYYAIEENRANYYYARLFCNREMGFRQNQTKCNIASVITGNLPSTVPNLTIIQATNYFHCAIPKTLIDYDPEGSTSLHDCISRDLPVADWQIVAPLVTKQTYHFDNIGQLYTYLGTNNVWIDTGAITECIYPADTKLYIDGITEPDEDMIADANIASGKYFSVNNKLYLSTAAIAAGASIVPGTNCTATNLAEALNTLNT